MSLNNDLSTDLPIPLQAGLPYIIRAREAQQQVIRGLRDVHRAVLRFLPTAFETNIPPATMRYQNAIRNTLAQAGTGYLALYGQQLRPEWSAHQLGDQLLTASEALLMEWFTAGVELGVPPVVTPGSEDLPVRSG